MRIRRVSPNGITFFLGTVCENRNQTTIQLAGTEKQIIVEADLEQINQSWYNWQIKGDKIQEAFPYLDSDEREFILDGLIGE